MTRPLSGKTSVSATVLSATELVFELRARDAMTPRPVALCPSDTMARAKEVMRDRRISGLPVVDPADPQRLLGLVSLADLINCLELDQVGDPVEHWMSRELITVRESASLYRAAREFERRKVGRLPVLDAEGRLVGILTRGDIVKRVMVEMGRVLEQLSEHDRDTAAPAPVQPAAGDADSELVLRSDVASGQVEHAGEIASRVKTALRRRGVPARVIRRTAIAVYEAEANITIHSVGGEIVVRVRGDTIRVEARDRGPGIPDLAAAMEDGYSTASDFVRSLGFGAGMGLGNMKRNADRFDIQSSPAGTVVTIENRIDGAVGAGAAAAPAPEEAEAVG